MKHVKKQKTHTLFGFIAFGLSYILFLMLTDPNNLALGMLLIPSALLAITSYYFVRFLQEALGFKKSHSVALAISFLTVLISMLASLGQLTLRDFVLSTLLVGVFIFYFERSKTK